MQYGNFTSGIRDTSVFDIPEYCHHTAAKCAPNLWQAVANMKFTGEGNLRRARFTVTVDFVRHLEVYDGFIQHSDESKNVHLKIFKNFTMV